jgi:uncharacterized protein
VLVKPAGPDCNLGCTYCFYSGKQQMFGGAPHRMSDDLLERLVRQALEAAGPEIAFCWQGGEPTLMGVEFFEHATALQRRHGARRRVLNSLQTNGLALDRRWARFLAENGFLVGLSIDGPEHVHDRYRHARDGAGTFARARDRAKLLLDSGVEVNALAVVTNDSVEHAAEIYGFFKELGLRHMQFVPAVERHPDDPARPASFSCPPEPYGAFLAELFDLWLADFSGSEPTTSVRLFDSVFYSYVGLEPPECSLLAECGNYLVVEHDGSVFPCDFFVEPGWRLGNLRADRLVDLLDSERQARFGAIKSALPRECRDCRWLRHCRGGCPKDRLARGNGARHNHLCAGLKVFFEHADERLRGLADWWQSSRPELAEGARRAQLARSSGGPGKVGRNDPCPCGSGRKYKKCCLRSLSSR